MLVDDDSDDRLIFAETLKSINASTHCMTYKSGFEALASLDTQKTLPDIAFLDINMPVMTGWEMLRKIKKNERLQKIPIIVYSTSSYERDVIIARDLGASGFCTKPEDVRDLKYILEFVIENLHNLKEILDSDTDIPFFRKMKNVAR
jgi:CheY-like chemotaxis protein